VFCFYVAREEVYDDKPYEVASATRELDVDVSTIRRYIQNGDIVAFKLGKKWR
jgi:hypothetical protein